MDKIISAVLFCLFSLAFFPALAQKKPSELQIDSTKVFISADVAPQFPGGDKAMLLFLQEQLKEVDFKDKPEGVAVLSIVVTKEGLIKDIQVIRSLEPSLDQAAIEAIKKMPRWIPGSHKGQIVDVRYTLPVRFSKQNQQKTKTKQKKKS